MHLPSLTQTWPLWLLVLLPLLWMAAARHHTPLSRSRMRGGAPPPPSHAAESFAHEGGARIAVVRARGFDVGSDPANAATDDYGHFRSLCARYLAQYRAGVCGRGAGMEATGKQDGGTRACPLCGVCGSATVAEFSRGDRVRRSDVRCHRK